MTFSESSSPSSPSPGFRRGPRVADLMTKECEAFVASAIAAERAGDAETALEYHQGVPMFRRGAHKILLTQLAGLSEEMPPWLWARWTAYQATRAEDRGTACGESMRTALDYVVQTFHDDELERLWEEGGDPAKLVPMIAGEDWSFHQICTYELHGLELFLDTMPTDRLAEECTLAREWLGARIGGYRIESASPGRVVVRSLAEDRPVDVLDLGASLLGPDASGEGGWVIGRLVPSGTTPALMFDTRPLPVDEQTARDASTGDRRGAWITALDEAFADGRLDRSLLRSEDRELVTDVPSLDLLRRGAAPAALGSTMAQLRRGRDEVGRAAYRVLRAVADGSFGPDADAPYVAAAVVHPHAFAEAQRELTGPGCRGAWEHWAPLVPAPARGRLTRLAELSAAADAA